MRFDGIPDDWSEIEGVIRARAGLIPFGAGRARLTSKDGAREEDHFHDVDEIVTARRARARRSTTPSNRPHWKHLSSSRGGRPAELDDQEIQKMVPTPQALLAQSWLCALHHGSKLLRFQPRGPGKTESSGQNQLTPFASPAHSHSLSLNSTHSLSPRTTRHLHKLLQHPLRRRRPTRAIQQQHGD